MSNGLLAILAWLIGAFVIQGVKLHKIKEQNNRIIERLEDPMYDHCRARGQVGGVVK